MCRLWQPSGTVFTLEAAAAALFGRALSLEQDKEHTDGSSNCGASEKDIASDQQVHATVPDWRNGAEVLEHKGSLSCCCPD